jgi:hypothetical protein
MGAKRNAYRIFGGKARRNEIARKMKTYVDNIEMVLR